MTKEHLKNLNLPILLTTIALLAFGLLFIWSGSYVLSGPDGESIHLRRAQKQAVWIAVGMFAMVMVLWPHYKKIIENAYVIYGLIVSLLVVLMVLSAMRMVPVINGARRWIPLGFFNLQPSELMKVALILCLAQYLQFRSSYRTWKGLIIPFALTFCPMVLIMKQPDLGTSLLFVPVLFSMLFAAGARLRHLLLITGMVFASAPLMYFFVLRPYQRSRILAFLHQSDVNSPMAMNELYQLIQSKLAIGSGGWLGNGWQQGAMNRLNFLPVRTTDFIFAVIGEEMGFIGLMVVLALYFFLFMSAFAIAERTREPSGRLVVIGSTVLLATQLYINTSMTIGLMPTTGLTLPFVSYGGSSLVTTFVLIGLILNIGLRQTRIVASDDFEFQDDILRRRKQAEMKRWITLFDFQNKIGLPQAQRAKGWLRKMAAKCREMFMKRET